MSFLAARHLGTLGLPSPDLRYVAHDLLHPRSWSLFPVIESPLLLLLLLLPIFGRIQFATCKFPPQLLPSLSPSSSSPFNFFHLLPRFTLFPTRIVDMKRHTYPIPTGNARRSPSPARTSCRFWLPRRTFRSHQGMPLGRWYFEGYLAECDLRSPVLHSSIYAIPCLWHTTRARDIFKTYGTFSLVSMQRTRTTCAPDITIRTCITHIHVRRQVLCISILMSVPVSSSLRLSSRH